MTTFSQLFEPVEARQFERVQAHFDAAEYDAAILLLHSLQQSLPNDPRVLLQSTRIGLATGNAIGAREAGKRLLAVAANWQPVWIELADVLKQDQQFEACLSFAKKAILAKESTAQDVFRAADCAAAAGDFASVTDALNRAHQLAPERLDILWHKARNELQNGALNEARHSFSKLLEALPGNNAALAGLANTKLQLGERQSALADFETLIALEPENQSHAFFVALCKGTMPQHYPSGLSETLFDRYARAYDKHMVGSLKHRAPKDIAAMIKSDFSGQRADLLDLGCGTGLVSLYLGKHPGARVGVDVSANMLVEAQRLKLYHRLHQVNLIDALADTPSEQYDAITACDVFGYVANLEASVSHTLRILRQHGRAYASFELPTSTTEDQAVNTGLRFCRSKTSVQTLYRAAGFGNIEIVDCTLRIEKDEPVAGFIISAQKLV